MTFEQLDTHVNKYLVYLKQQRAIKDIGHITYKILYSKKSRSFYVKLDFTSANNQTFRKTVRFSDHEYQYNPKCPQKVRGIVLEPSKQFSKKEIKYVEATLRKEIRKLQYCAYMTTLTAFHAEPL